MKTILLIIGIFNSLILMYNLIVSTVKYCIDKTYVDQYDSLRNFVYIILISISFGIFFTSCTTTNDRFTKCNSRLGAKKKEYYNSIQYPSFKSKIKKV